MHITTFDQLGIAKYRPKQEIIDVITKSNETNELWIKGCITQHGMNIALWTGVVEYFKIEIIHFMIDTKYIMCNMLQQLYVQQDDCKTGQYVLRIRYVDTS